ncbi:MAG: DJ-1/PfpI family protein [Deltaproteobacteria bacterium]|nr:DJ-1/PfpI family protein [Deltaproteobacteria bacterium]
MTRLAGKRVLMVVAPEGFRDEELSTPRQILEANGATVTVGSTKSGQAHGMMGARALATVSVDSCRASDYDAVVIVGGDGAARHLWDHAGLARLVTDAATAERILGAICLGPVVLAKAGLLAGREATVWKSESAEAAMRRAGARLVDRDLVAVGRIVTARGPHVALAFAERLVEEMRASRPYPGRGAPTTLGPRSGPGRVSEGA